ncbi:MAG: hypothetical protein HC906_09545, partial [Bacteroidales bacterium]|nr:hypothetical protein [Bacteroidales bacterium]
MDLNDYFNPVELEKPTDYFISRNETFGKNIRINTLNEPIDEISNYHIAIMGVPEDRNSYNTGSAGASDQVRNKLY